MTKSTGETKNSTPPKVHRGRLTEPGFLHQMLITRVPVDEWDKVMEPTYWGRHAMTLKTGDFLKCVREDSGAWCDLYIAATAPNGPTVDVRKCQQGEMAIGQHERYEDKTHIIEWQGLTDEFTIVQKSNGATLAKNIRSMSEARHRLVTDHTFRRVA